MCGRYYELSDPRAIAQRFGISGDVPNFPPNYNAAPTQTLPVVRYNQETEARSLDLLRWGLVPHWAKDLSVGYKMINARAEGVAEKPSFRQAFQKRRCLIPADGFYEWRREGKAKQPFAIALKDDEPMALAGLWENWKDPAGEWIRTFTIITTTANSLVGEIHDRMPVILDEADWSKWLGEKPSEPEELIGLLRPFAADRMALWPVSDRVNNARVNEPGLFEPLPPANSA